MNSTEDSTKTDVNETSSEQSSEQEVVEEEGSIVLQEIDDEDNTISIVDSLEDDQDSEEIEEIDPIELLSEKEAKARIYELNIHIEKTMTERNTARDKVNELAGRLKSVSAAYQRQGEEVLKAKERLERQSKFKEDRRRGEVVSSLFEPYENLKRSIDAMSKAEVDSSHLDGLQLVASSILNAFNGLGLEEIPGVGSKFDPIIHEALMTTQTKDLALKDAVMQVFAAGYRIGELVLRPAKVIVGLYEEPPAPVDDSPQSEDENSNDGDETD